MRLNSKTKISYAIKVCIVVSNIIISTFNSYKAYNQVKQAKIAVQSLNLIIPSGGISVLISLVISMLCGFDFCGRSSVPDGVLVLCWSNSSANFARFRSNWLLKTSGVAGGDSVKISRGLRI